MANVRSILTGAAIALGMSSTAVASCPHPCIVIDQNFPDPSFVKSNGSFHAFATSKSGNPFVKYATSPDFVNWEVSTEDPPPNKAGWETDELWWAPHVNQRVSEKIS